MEENTRIPDSLISPSLNDGDILYHELVNKMIQVFKAGINANYSDIKSVIEELNSVQLKVKDATLSKASETSLQNNDQMFPSSRQVKNYVDTSVQKQVPTTLSSLEGYDVETTQVLKNINGVLTWVTEE
jgi:hypothetical protein